VERALLRDGNVHSAKDWRAVLKPVVARYQGRNLRRYFRADAAFANPEVYEFLEAEGYGYAIRLPANDVLQRDIEPLLTRPVGRPPNAPVVWYPPSNRVEAKAQMSIALLDQDGEVGPVPTGGAAGKPEPEIDYRTKPMAAAAILGPLPLQRQVAVCGASLRACGPRPTTEGGDSCENAKIRPGSRFRGPKTKSIS
jgi:hypothetical protein